MPDASAIDLESADVRMLSDLGFVAMSRGLNNHAEAIFEGVKAARPRQEAGFIGSALVRMARGDVEGAIGILRGLGPSDAARVFLAMALARQGARADAREILTEIIRTSPDSAYAELARVTLEELPK
jgi:hypothetical protein